MKHLSIVLLIFVFFTSPAQEKPAYDTKYTFCYKPTSFETDDYKIYIEDAHSQGGFAKLKMRIFNKTNDYLIFNPADAVFKVGDQALASKDKSLIILPNEEGVRVISVKGKEMQEEKYAIELKSIQKVSANSAPLKTEDLSIPVTKKEVEAGNFKCNLKKEEVQTNETVLKFECIYNGDAIGILDPKKAVAIMPKGQENTNADKFKGCLLEKGKSEGFLMEFREMKGAGDMQKGPLKIKWNETFRESKPEALKGGTISMEMDRAKTSEKNQ